MGAHCCHPEFRNVRRQRQQFGFGLGAGVVTVRALWVRRLRAQPGDGGTGIGHGRGGHNHHVPHPGGTGSMEQAPGPFDVHRIELRGTAREGNLRGQVDDSFCAVHCPPQRFSDPPALVAERVEGTVAA